MSSIAPLPFGGPLRELRLKRGLSQLTLAARARCSLNTVSLAERGGFLSREMAERFAIVLEVDPQLLFSSVATQRVRS